MLERPGNTVCCICPYCRISAKAKHVDDQDTKQRDAPKHIKKGYTFRGLRHRHPLSIAQSNPPMISRSLSNHTTKPMLIHFTLTIRQWQRSATHERQITRALANFLIEWPFVMASSYLKSRLASRTSGGSASPADRHAGLVCMRLDVFECHQSQLLRRCSSSELGGSIQPASSP